MPLFVEEVMAFYTKRKSVLKSNKFVFAETYQEFFLNPDAEAMHR